MITYAAGSGRAKRDLVEQLGSAPLANSDAVLRLHEALCFLRAYPDDLDLLRTVEDALAGFGERSDLHRFRRSLEDTGVAGTAINYRFFWPTACWLTRHWPQSLSISWNEWDNRARLLDLLPHTLPYTETLALDEIERTDRQWIEELRGPSSDAAFLVGRIGQIAGDEFTREKTYDLLDVPLRLEPEAGTPARGQDVFPVADFSFQRAPLQRTRPHLREDVRRPPVSIAALSRARGRRLVDLARRAMVTRARDLDGFAHADPDDARWIDCGDGLAFGLLGLRPPRRLMLESSYAALMLKNGVPTLRLGGHRLQRLRDLPRRRGGAGVRARARHGPGGVRLRHLQHRSLPAGLRQCRRAGLGRLVVLLQARLPPSERVREASRSR